MTAAAAPASAEWPADRPIRVLVGFGAGGGTDIVSRIIAQPLSRAAAPDPSWSRTKSVPAERIAAETVARADKDGYTALMTSPAHTVSAAMLKSIRYDAVKDFAPVSWVADSAFVFVAKKDFPANDIKGLIALAKASPGKLNFADVGVGSTQNFAGELMRQMAGIDVKHIPYRNTPGVVTALLAGEVDYGVELAHAVRGQVEAGQLKLLAVGAPVALADHSQRADGRGIRRAGLCGGRLVRLALSGRHAAGDRRQDQCRAERGAGAARYPRAARQGRRRGACLDAGGIRQAYRRRNRQMEGRARFPAHRWRENPAVANWTPGISGISRTSIAITFPLPSALPTRFAAIWLQPPGAAPRSTTVWPGLSRRCRSVDLDQLVGRARAIAVTLGLRDIGIVELPLKPEF